MIKWKRDVKTETEGWSLQRFVGQGVFFMINPHETIRKCKKINHYIKNLFKFSEVGGRPQ